MQRLTIAILVVIGCAPSLLAQQQKFNFEPPHISDLFDSEYLKLPAGTKLVDFNNNDRTTPLGIFINTVEDLANHFLTNVYGGAIWPITSWMDFKHTLLKPYPSLQDRVAGVFDLFLDNIRADASAFYGFITEIISLLFNLLMSVLMIPASSRDTLLTGNVVQAPVQQVPRHYN